MRSQSKLFRALLGVCAVSAVTFSFERCLAQPSEVSYQGELKKDGLPFTGTAQMKFVVVDGDGESIWSNDGTSMTGSEPTDPVSIETENGIFAVRLGAAPMQPISGGLLKGVTEVALRVWVNTGDGFEQLTDQPISSSAFSLSGEKCLEIGELQINVIPRWNGSALVPGTLFDDGNYVGVGTNAPATKLDVSGTVRSSTGGFQFPDGTTQTTAVAGGGGGVPNGAMILTATPVPPDGYSYTGESVTRSGTGAWRARSDLPIAASGLVTIGCVGKVYTFGTTNGTTWVYEYDPETNRWSQKGNAPLFGYSDYAGTALGDSIYIVGGINGNVTQNTVLRYEPETDDWTSVTPMPTARYQLSVASVGNKLYAIGGSIDNQGNLTGAVEEYDPTLDSWTTKTPIPTPRSRAGVAAIDGVIYVAGGEDPAGLILEAYNSTTDSWSSQPQMPSPARFNFAIAASAGRLVCIGGYVNEGETATRPRSAVDEFDPISATWKPGPDISTRRYQTAAATVDDKIYVVGGTIYDEGNPSPSVTVRTTEAYTPEILLYVHQKQ